MKEDSLIEPLLWNRKRLRDTTESLLTLQGTCRLDGLLMAFEEALGHKEVREGRNSLSPEERVILAIEALEREVNNGGYSQFFINSSVEYAPILVESFNRIGCPRGAAVAQRAIDSLRLHELTVEAIEIAIRTDNEERDKILDECSLIFFDYKEDIGGRLFSFIRGNKDFIRL